jgi:hypothetical protein
MLWSLASLGITPEPAWLQQYMLVRTGTGGTAVIAVAAVACMLHLMSACWKLTWCLTYTAIVLGMSRSGIERPRIERPGISQMC